MIAKRTKSLTSPRAVMKWAGDYVDESRKHKGQDLGELGIGIGKKYFTSRPTGALTAHGYAKKRTEIVSVTLGLRGNDAVLAMLKEHCRERAMKKRKIYGLRFVMSLDPGNTAKLAPRMVDIDRLLVRSIEDTMTAIENQYYPGDKLGYVLGIHHDAITKDPNKPKRPHIHAHVMFLPQTEKGLRISFSNHTQPLRDGTYHDMLDAIRELYQTMTQHNIYDMNVLPEPAPTPEWQALVKECAYHAADDMKAQQGMAQERVRKFVLDKFSYYLTTSKRENVRKRYNYRMDLFLKQDGTVPTWQDLAYRITESLNYASKRLALQSQPLGEAATTWVSKREQTVKFWDFNPKAVMLRKPAQRSPNRTDKINQIFDEMLIKRQSYRVNLVGELAAQEMLYGELVNQAPEWLETLGRISAGELQMPNRDILRLEVPGEVPVEAVAPTAAESPKPATPNGTQAEHSSPVTDSADSDMQ